MKLLVQSAMIFFGTLMAAGLVALGEPGARHPQFVEPARPWVELLNTAEMGR